jgi:hypothetical protein
VGPRGMWTQRLEEKTSASVSDQHSGKGSQYPLYKRLEGSQSQPAHRGWGKILCLSWGSNPSCPVHNQTLYRLSYLAHAVTSITFLINKYNNRFLPMVWQFFIISNRINTYVNLRWQSLVIKALVIQIPINWFLNFLMTLCQNTKYCSIKDV